MSTSAGRKIGRGAESDRARVGRGAGSDAAQGRSGRRAGRGAESDGARSPGGMRKENARLMWRALRVQDC